MATNYKRTETDKNADDDDHNDDDDMTDDTMVQCFKCKLVWVYVDVRGVCHVSCVLCVLGFTFCVLHCVVCVVFVVLCCVCSECCMLWFAVFSVCSRTCTCTARRSQEGTSVS